MAYVSKELKTNIVNNIKAKAKELGVNLKFSAKVEHGTTLVVNISGCSENIQTNNIEHIESVLLSNHSLDVEKEKLLYSYMIKNIDYHPIKNVEENKGGLAYTDYIFGKDSFEFQFSGKTLEIIKAIVAEMERYNYDKSDSMSDYFNVGYYTRLTIGNTKTGIAVL